MQLQCRGFNRNRRQHRQFGLAVIEAAQELRARLDGLRNGTEEASAVPWRRLLDVCVRWRQLSEPNDPVWWIDTLPRESFEDGFGLQTCILNGQLKVQRYYGYFPRALEVLRAGMQRKVHLADNSVASLAADAKARVRGAQTLKECYDEVGGDFWITTPCASRLKPNVVLEGTRLTLVRTAYGGYEFSIRTASTPPRWRQMDAEMEHAHAELCQAALMYLEFRNAMTRDALVEAALTLFYYWVSFAPLTRGSAAVGLAILRASLLACGIDMTGRIPKDVQMDWEAIFSATADDFIAKVRPWFFASLSEDEARWVRDVPSAAEALPTIRDRIMALNTALDEALDAESDGAAEVLALEDGPSA